MGFSISPLWDTKAGTLISQFLEKHFPGLQVEGISEITGHSPYTEYDIWIEGHPIIHKVVLSNNWAPDQASTDKVYLKEVQLHSDLVLISDDKNEQVQEKEEDEIV